MDISATIVSMFATASPHSPVNIETMVAEMLIFQNGLIHERMEEIKKRRNEEWKERRKEEQMHACMNRWIDGLMHAWMNRENEDGREG